MVLWNRITIDRSEASAKERIINQPGLNRYYYHVKMTRQRLLHAWKTFLLQLSRSFIYSNREVFRDFRARFYLDANRQREPSSNYARRMQVFSRRGDKFRRGEFISIYNKRTERGLLWKVRANINFSKRRVSRPRNILHQIRINHVNELSDFPRRRKTLLSVEKPFRAKIFHLQSGIGYLKYGKLKRSGQV